MLDTRRICSLILTVVLTAPPTAAAQQAPQADLQPAVFSAFQNALNLSYLELFDDAAGLEFSPTQIRRMREYVKRAKDACAKGFKEQSKSLDKVLAEARSELRRESGKLSEQQRHDLHCTIQNHRIEQEQAQMFARHSVPLAYAHKEAKLDLIEYWPGEAKRIAQDIASRAYRQREHGDVEDIGFREIIEGQAKDIERGKEAIDEMRRLGMMPKELEDEKVFAYVNGLAQRVAARSDLQVPLQVTLLDSEEINAFALPGGYLFINRGLLEAVEDDSQLVGVLAHEMAHVAARHGHRLMKKATIASILYQAAQVGAVIFTGGAVGIGTYYALQYGFYGLGLALSLELLGVSRDYELEADQLGVQYAWNAGYDPYGFIQFFDKMATREGYIRGASWFRTHPPFYQRMVQSRREIAFLPAKADLVVETDEFHRFQKNLEGCAEGEERSAAEQPCKPTLLEPYEKDCPLPNKIDYQPGQPIEAVCFPTPLASQLPAY
ncbi:MAG: M48 family metalloprotease [Bryobacterales bacterium]